MSFTTFALVNDFFESSDAARFSNQQAVMQWAYSAPLVGIVLAETPNPGGLKSILCPPTSGIIGKNSTLVIFYLINGFGGNNLQ